MSRDPTRPSDDIDPHGVGPQTPASLSHLTQAELRAQLQVTAEELAALESVVEALTKKLDDATSTDHGVGADGLDQEDEWIETLSAVIPIPDAKATAATSARQFWLVH